VFLGQESGVNGAKEVRCAKMLRVLSALRKTRQICKKCKAMGLRVLSALQEKSECGMWK
jgi:hypothetical protein